VLAVTLRVAASERATREVVAATCAVAFLRRGARDRTLAARAAVPGTALVVVDARSTAVVFVADAARAARRVVAAGSTRLIFAAVLPIWTHDVGHRAIDDAAAVVATHSARAGITAGPGAGFAPGASARGRAAALATLARRARRRLRSAAAASSSRRLACTARDRCAGVRIVAQAFEPARGAEQQHGDAQRARCFNASE